MNKFFYSGYIRNCHILCHELAIDIHPDRKETEARIIREGYKKWGHSLGRHLCGYFAVSLYDEQKQEIFCMRDPFGREALYYSITDDGRFVCSYKLSDILMTEGFVKELNADAIEPYLEHGYLSGEMTFFKNIKMLPPAHYLIWDGNEVITGCYLEKAVSEKPVASKARTERINDILEEIAAEDAEAFPDCFKMEQLNPDISAENFFYALPWVMRYFDQPQTDPDVVAYMLGLREPTRYINHFSCFTGRTAFYSMDRGYPDQKLVQDFRNINQIANAYNIDILTPFCDARLLHIAEDSVSEDTGYHEEADGKGKADFYRIYAFVLWYEEHFCSENTEWMLTTRSTADIFFVQDYETGEVLYEKNAHKRHPIASITKLAAALVVARHISDPENTYITVTQEVIDSIWDREAAYAGFQDYIGCKFSCLDLLYGSLVSSGCESVELLADYICDGNIQDFIAEMNDVARETGCQNTLFYDTCGLMEEGQSTAADIALILKAVFEIPFLKRILSTSFYKLQLFNGALETTNEMINPKDPMEGFCPYCIGGKTGTTTLAGVCIGALFERNGKKYISVVLNEDFTRHPSGTKMVFHMCKEEMYQIFENTGHFIQISLPEHYKMLSVGSTYFLKPKVIRNTGCDNVQYSFFSSDDNIADVDSEGVVTVKREGIVQLTVMTQTGDYDLCFLNSTGQTEVTLRRFEIPGNVTRK